MKYLVCEAFSVETQQGKATVPAGKILELSEDQAARLGGKVRPADEAPAPPVPFSRQNAFDRLRALYEELDRESWPELLTAWLQDFHPAALQRIRKSTQQIDDAFKAGNDRQLDRALTEQRAAWLAGLALYRSQPELSGGENTI